MCKSTGGVCRITKTCDYNVTKERKQKKNKKYKNTKFSASKAEQ